MAQYRFELFFNSTWKDSNALKPVFYTDESAFSFTTDQKKYQFFHPFIISINDHGDLLLSNINNSIFLYNYTNKELESIPLSNTIEGKIIDHKYEKQNIFILTLIEENTCYKLAKIDSTGEELWELKISDFQCKKIIIENKEVFLHAEKNNLAQLIQVNNTSGNREKTIEHKYYSERIFKADKHFLSIDYYPEHERRGVSIINPITGESEKKLMNAQNSVKLLYPLGISEDEYVYTFIPQAFDESGINKISYDNKIQSNILFTDLDIFNNQVYILNFTKNKTSLTKYKIETRENEIIDLSEIFSSLNPDNVSIHEVLNSDQMIICVSANFEETFYLLDIKTKKISEEGENKLFKRKLLQAYDSWEFDATGNIYIPIIKPDGFYILKLCL